MYPVIHILSLIGLISLTLGGLTGCGEKRVHVATMSGAPGAPQTALPQLEENLPAQPSGLTNTSVDESNLSSQIPDESKASEEPETSGMSNAPINVAHEPSAMTPETEPDLSDAMAAELESGVSDTNGSLAPLAEGQDFSAQSSSSSDNHSNLSSPNSEGFQGSTTDQPSDSMPSSLSQEALSGLQDTLSGEGIEAIPGTIQVAKATPSDSLQDQMNRIKEEELAAAAVGLEDVFFQFDSWTLTQEGKAALERAVGLFEQNPSSNLIIEGHADQRGTQAYNMVLAKKRAAAVQDYLKQAGVDPSHLAIISYGKDKPFCQDATEVCYQLNRRGHLLIQKP